MEEVTKTVLDDGSIKYKNNKGKLHREDGPAFIWSNGNKEYWLNGKRHREDGPAFIWADGSKAWWLNGKRHREDGPAFIDPDGSKEYWLNGILHREDGPAIIDSDGHKEYWIDGVHYTKEEFNTKTGNDTVSTTHDIDFTYESKIYTSINEFKKYLHKQSINKK